MTVRIRAATGELWAVTIDGRLWAFAADFG